VGGAPDIINHGENGYLVDVGDVAGMAKYALKLLDDDEARLKMSEAARESMLKGFRWQDMVDNYLKLYEQVLEDPENIKGLAKVGKKCF
jgi:glycosyltransferase involved in cell wall biosynthesis